MIKGVRVKQNGERVYRRWTEGKKPRSSRQGRDKCRGEPQVDDGWTETKLTTGIPNIQSIREVAACQEKRTAGNKSKPAALKRSCEETHRALSKRVTARVFVDPFGRSRWVCFSAVFALRRVSC